LICIEWRFQRGWRRSRRARPPDQRSFADLEPAFLPDGTGLVFVTERYSTNLETLEAGPLRWRGLDLATMNHAADSGLPGGKHLSPQGAWMARQSRLTRSDGQQSHRTASTVADHADLVHGHWHAGTPPARR
jgi:hypothetical protein